MYLLEVDDRAGRAPPGQLSDYDTRGRNYHSRFRVVVVVERRRRGPRLEAVTRLEFERELHATGPRAQITADLRFDFVVTHRQSQRARIAKPEVSAPLSRALVPRLITRFDNLRRRPSRIARAPDFNAVVSPAEER